MWTRIDIRPPTKADADRFGCVLAWHELQGVLIRGWQNLYDSRFITHWMRTPDDPENGTAKAERRDELEP